MITDNLQAFWDFNNSLVDSIGGKVLTPQFSAGCSYQTEGIKLTETCLHYDEFPFNSTYTMIIQVYNLTKSASCNSWGILTTGIGGGSGIGGRINGIGFYGTNLNIYTGQGDGGTRFLSPSKLISNKWNTLVFRYDGVNTEAFINNIKVSSSPGNALINNNIYIGATMNTPGGGSGVVNGYANGVYKNLAIYNRVLTNNEIFNYTDITQKVDINNIQLGTKIPGTYSSCTANKVGDFFGFGLSNEGLTSISDIPVTSSNIPSGKFNWIYVGKDYLGRKKFIADRNIQHSISWNNLNASGICDEKIIDLGLGSTYITSIRLPTGGTSVTDTDNEWDQIIVNSTLNNTITVGGDNVWNCGDIWSWTSTTINPYSTNRVARRLKSPSYNYNITTTIDGQYGFRPVLLIEPLISAPIFTGNLLSSSIHTEDAILTGSIADINNPIQKVQYKILLNDTKIYPDSNYTELQTSPVNINYTIPNSLLTNTNNKIKIIMNNESNEINSNNFYVTLYNNAPTGILSLSNITTHSDNIELTGNITDTDLDKISYRILINDIEKSMWSTFASDPYVDYIISANDLIIGSNKIVIEYKDNYKNVGLGNWTNTITRTNSIPIVNCQYINGSIIGMITDPDSDMVQYRILINGTQKYPETQEYSDLEQVANVDYQINRNDILIGKNNIITIFAKDSLNSSVGQEISFMGDYVGLMFSDENKQYYSTDIGELLKYLDFGTITLGQITEPIKILVQNKYGFKIKDINLNVNSALPNINIEFSKEENPFIATDKLLLEKEYAINEEDYFYIRLSTSVSSNSVNGMFKITAKATPLA